MKLQKTTHIHNTKRTIFKPNYIKFTMNIMPKNYLTETSHEKLNVTKFKKIQKKCLNFAPKIAINPYHYWKLPVSQTCHKPVTNVSQTCHKSVTNTSQIRHKKED